MKLTFEGEMDYFGDSTRDSCPTIGGRDIIAELDKAWPRQSTGERAEVRVLLGVEVEKASLTSEYVGGLFTYVGFGGGEETPPESPEIKVGGVELLRELLDHDGKTVALVVEDA